MKAIITFGLFATDAAVTAFEAHSGEQFFRRTEAGEAALQQVQADEGGKRQEPLGDEDRAVVVAEGQREQDEKARHDADDAFDGHD